MNTVHLRRLASRNYELVLSFSLRCEACAAVNRLSFGGLEGHLALTTAFYANSREHFSCTLLRILSRCTAVLASGRLILKALGCIEFLLTGSEHEIVATIFALQCLVLEHVCFSTLKIGIILFALRRIPTDAFVNQRSPLSYLGI